MPGSSNWIILYDKTSGQVTRRVWDDDDGVVALQLN